MTDREPRPLPRPTTIAAWCPTCQTTQACVLPPEASASSTYSCVVCGHPASNPVVRFDLSARHLADPAA
jgi:Zn ribbon nucleic-acid-binding protein